MSLFVQAYHKGEPIGWTDICAGDSLEMRKVFIDTLVPEMETHEMDPDLSWAYVTQEEVQNTLDALEKHPAPLWKEFLKSLLEYDVVKITIR